MTYTPDDLALFKPILDLEAREGSCYFEFHPKEILNPPSCWIEGSLLITDAAFDFISELFYSVDPEFDYFSFQRFDGTKIDKLCGELEKFIHKLESDDSRPIAFCAYSSLFSDDIWSGVPTDQLNSAIRGCASSLLQFIRENTKESRCLWVFGM